MNSENTIRQRILDAALDILEDRGVKGLTQPRVAKLAGLRQSHLTYYFPRKADLFVAVLQASHDRASRKRGARAGQENFDEGMKSLKKLMFDKDRMRFFLGIIVEASEEPGLRPILANHARELTQSVAAHFGRAGDDPAVIAFVDLLRGAGLRMLLEPNRKNVAKLDLEALAASIGLHKAGTR